jgi:hypothetical protein
MLTIFTTAKPFKGHNAVIQRNALKSWTLLHPNVEVIVFGDDQGSAEVCRALGLRHQPEVARTPHGSVRVDDLFARAQILARHDLLCYANCDILLLDDFVAAIERISQMRREFLAVGRRTDLDVRDAWPFERTEWRRDLRELGVRSGKVRPASWIDYFVFTRGLYGNDVPPFALGRTKWDDWLVWKILDSKKPVIDISNVVRVYHQNHDYSHHSGNEQGVWKGEEAQRNFALSGGLDHIRTIADATLMLRSDGIRPNRKRHFEPVKRFAAAIWRLMVYRVWNPIWLSFLHVTRPLRSVMGLRGKAIPSLRRR